MIGGENEEFPKFVEVTVAGMKLLYPSCYVLVTEETDLESRSSKQQQPQQPAPSSKTNNKTTAPMLNNNNKTAALLLNMRTDGELSKHQMGRMNPRTRVEMREGMGEKVVDKTWQDWVLSSGLLNNSVGTQSNETTDHSNHPLTWEFANPAQKFDCLCHKSKPTKAQATATTTCNNNPKCPVPSPFTSTATATAATTTTLTNTSTKGLQSLANYSGTSSWKQQQGVVKIEKLNDTQPIRLHKNHTPYHRRHTHLNHRTKDQKFNHNINFSLTSTFGSHTSKNTTFVNNSKNTCNNTHLQNNNIAFNNNSNNNNLNKSFLYGVAVFDSSPNSAAPSPLLASHVTASSTNQNGDATMPTLSPQPSSKNSTGGAEIKVEVVKEEADSKNKTYSNPKLQLNNYSNNNTQHVVNSPATNQQPTASLLFQHYSTHDFKHDSDFNLGKHHLDSSLKTDLMSRIRCADIGKTWLERKLRRKGKRWRIGRPVLSSMFGDEEEENKIASFRLHHSILDHNCYTSSSKPPTQQQQKKELSNTNATTNKNNNDSNFSLHNRASSMLGGYQDKKELGEGMKHEGNTNRSIHNSHKSDEMLNENNEAYDQYRVNSGLSPANNNNPNNNNNNNKMLSSSGSCQATTLMTENDLIPNIQDLDKMFDTDEEADSDSPTMPINKHEKSRDYPNNYHNTTLMQHHNNHNNNLMHHSNNNNNIMQHSNHHNQLLSNHNNFSTTSTAIPQGLSVKDLSRMFPTPPSADNPGSEPSPQTTHDLDHPSDYPSTTSLQHYAFHPYIKEELGVVSANLASLKKNCSSLFRHPILTRLPASKHYKAIKLNSITPPHPLVYQPPSSSSSSSSSSFLSLSSSHSSYKQLNTKTCGKNSPATLFNNSNYENTLSYQQQKQYLQQQINRNKKENSTFTQQQQQSMISMMNQNNQPQQQQTQQQQFQQQQRTPLNYDLMSPASNASSLNRQQHSIDNINNINSVSVEDTPPCQENTTEKGLSVNIGLSDSMLNIFKDQNFDSCTLCACNRNIEGADIHNTYLPPPHSPSHSSDDQFRCTCAFSAIINRRYGHNSGLFYEDEVDITGYYHRRFDNILKPSLLLNNNIDNANSNNIDNANNINNSAISNNGLNNNKNRISFNNNNNPLNNNDTNFLNNGNNNNDNNFLNSNNNLNNDTKFSNQINNNSSSNTTDNNNDNDDVSNQVFSLLRQHFSSQFPSPYVVANYKQQYDKYSLGEEVNELEMKDCSQVCLSVLGLNSRPTSSNKTDSLCVHKWAFYQASAPLASNSRDVVRLLKRLQPLLQDAIQKRRTTRSWESVYTISGPLTWKDFHLLAGRGSRETSEPKSLPCLLVGHDKQWLNVAPHAVRHWDKMQLGPLGEAKDVLFLAIAPDNDLVISQATLFFNDLAGVYEQCRLGKHRALSDKLRGGIMRAGKKSDDLVNGQVDDQWFTNIGNTSIASKLRLYAKICCKLLVNFIVKNLREKRKLYEEVSRRQSMEGGNRFSISNPDHPAFSYYHSQSSIPNHMPPPSSTQPNNNINNNNNNSGLTPCNIPQQHHNNDHTTNNNAYFSSDKKDVSSNDITDTDSLDQSGFSTEVIQAGQMPYVVLYIIDPFNYTHDQPSQTSSSQPSSPSSSSSSSRLGVLGILRCFQNMMKLMPANMQSCIQLQIIPQKMILNPRDHQSLQSLKNTCFSVYTACNRQLQHSTLARTLTNFGPTFSDNKQINKFLQQQQQQSSQQQQQQNLQQHQMQQQQLMLHNSNYTRDLYFNNIQLSDTSIFSSNLYCPPFVLSPSYCQVSSILQPDNWKEQAEESGILMCAYCLSEDQRFLLASVVDNTGELLETTCVNISVPNRKSRRKATVRRYALHKMWEFLMGVVSTTTRPWRLVVGRFGRLGHGELKGWSIILSKKNLLASSQKLKKMCSPLCTSNTAPSATPPFSQCPSILSACLVSTEMHPFIHIMLDSVKKEESQSSKRQLSTPRDASCSHILVYPTSATAQATDSNTSDTHMDFTTTFDEEGLLPGMEAEDPDVIDDFWIGLHDHLDDDNHNHTNPLFPTTDLSIDPASQQSRATAESTMASLDLEESNSLNLLQQPQAMGFYVSTAPPGPLPQWFWSSCLHRKNYLPVCFKASLHLHCPMVQQNQDDLINHSHKKTSHPLDSYLTCDVLRYVLETYNALSWLSIDACTNERRSCLPVHMFVLMQLYHGINTFI